MGIFNLAGGGGGGITVASGGPPITIVRTWSTGQAVFFRIAPTYGTGSETNDQTVESNAQTPAGFAHKMISLRCRVIANGLQAGETITFALRANGADIGTPTAIDNTFTAGTLFNVPCGSTSMAQDDLMCIRGTASALGASRTVTIQAWLDITVTS